MSIYLFLKYYYHETVENSIAVKSVGRYTTKSNKDKCMSKSKIFWSFVNWDALILRYRADSMAEIDKNPKKQRDQQDDLHQIQLWVYLCKLLTKYKAWGNFIHCLLRYTNRGNIESCSITVPDERPLGDLLQN